MNGNPNDLYDETQEDVNFLAEQNKKLCVADDQSVRLWDGERWYEIEFTACNSNEKIIQWIYHLTELNWITPKQIHLFLQAVFSQFPNLSRD